MENRNKQLKRNDKKNGKFNFEKVSARECCVYGFYMKRNINKQKKIIIKTIVKRMDYCNKILNTTPLKNITI